MQSSLGVDWASNFASFDRVPFAAASIGQVHAAVLAAGVSPTGESAGLLFVRFDADLSLGTGRDEPVAVKIQFPNIRESIESDLGYVKVRHSPPLCSNSALRHRDRCSSQQVVSSLAASSSTARSRCAYTHLCPSLKTRSDCG